MKQRLGKDQVAATGVLAHVLCAVARRQFREPYRLQVLVPVQLVPHRPDPPDPVRITPSTPASVPFIPSCPPVLRSPPPPRACASPSSS